MNRGSNRWRWPAGGAVLVVIAAIVAGVLMSSGGDAANAPGGRLPARHGAAGSSSAAAAPAPASGSGSATVSGGGSDPAVTLTVGRSGGGQRIAPGFLGFSIEFQAVRAYTGPDPKAINPVLVNLIRNLTPGQAPVVRIGGDSSDVSYVPGRGFRPPAYVDYALTPSWLATTGALARALHARMIMGLNLGANEPALAAAEARAYARALPAHSIDALEIGNEPNVYGKIVVDHTLFGVPVPTRPVSYRFAEFQREFDAIEHAAAPPTLAGPALALGPTPEDGAWVNQMPGFMHSQKRLAIMTVHRYPLRNCYVPPASSQYPSVAHLLSPYATAGLAGSLTRWIQIAHHQHKLLRVDELNSVACRGKPGVSDVFASALWATDALFSLADAGVDGIDMHTLPKSAYQLFAFDHDGGRWSAQVPPVYYGLQLFAQAAPAGSRILPLGGQTGGVAPGLSSWATRAPDGTVRVVLIDKSTQRGQRVIVRLPAGATRATVERMLAPGVDARDGVTLGGQSYGPRTFSGKLGAPHTTPATAAHGGVTVTVAPGSAALLTFGH